MPDFIGHVRRHLARHDVADARYDEVVDEIASELEARYGTLIEHGATEEDAWRQVLAQVPSWPSLARDLAAAGIGGSRRDTSQFHAESRLSPARWLHELALGIRVLRKERGFTITAIVTLAVCLGGHAAILAGVNAIVFNALRTPQPDRVVLMANQYPGVATRRDVLSATPDYHDRLRYVTAFEQQAFYNGFGATVESGGIATRMRGMVASPSLFRLLRVTPAHGRLFTEDESTLGNETRVLLTDGLWKELYGGDPAAVGRTLRLTGREYTIVGILPEDFVFTDPGARFWVPLALTDRQRSDDARHSNGWFSIGRLKPGATIEQVQTQLAALDAVNYERTPPRLQPLLKSAGFYTGAEPLQDVLVRDVQAPLYLLWAAAIGVLVIGVGNLCNIALVRSRARLSELGTRLALGARRIDVARQLLIESSVVAICGAAGGVAVGAWMLTALGQREDAPLHMDGSAVAITFVLAACIGVVIGLVSASPLVTMRLGTMLHASSRSRTGGRAVRATRRTLVVAQMACSFVLLVGCALLWVSLRNLMAVDPGFTTDNVITGVVSLPNPRYAADDAARSFVSRSLDSIRQLPGVAAAGAATIVPLGNASQSGLIFAEGYTPQAGEPPVSGMRSHVTAGYFEAVGTRLLRGRYFDERDNLPTSTAIIIDEGLAKRFWPDGDAVGRRVYWPSNPEQFAIGANTRWLTVVGVVRTALLRGPAPDQVVNGTTGTFYLPYAVAAPRNVGFVVRTHGEPLAIGRDVRSVLASIDRDIPLFDVRTLSERTELALMSRTNIMRLAAMFAAVAMFLSAVGLYGVLAYLVAQRRREIGVRMALGSAPSAIVGLVLREGLGMALAGVLIGALGSLALGRVVAAQLYGIEPSNPWVLLVMMLTLLAVAALACLLPARRAARVDVMRTLTAQ
jgi:predicted permease